MSGDSHRWNNNVPAFIKDGYQFSIRATVHRGESYVWFRMQATDDAVDFSCSEKLDLPIKDVATITKRIQNILPIFDHKLAERDKNRKAFQAIVTKAGFKKVRGSATDFTRGDATFKIRANTVRYSDKHKTKEQPSYDYRNLDWLAEQFIDFLKAPTTLENVDINSVSSFSSEATKFLALLMTAADYGYAKNVPNIVKSIQDNGLRSVSQTLNRYLDNLAIEHGTSYFPEQSDHANYVQKTSPAQFVKKFKDYEPIVKLLLSL